MNLTNLTAISPVDGRYCKQTQELGNYFSEAALIRYRTLVEVEYFIALIQLGLPQFSGIKNVDSTIAILKNIINEFDLDDAERVKEIEKETNHDVKAVEKFLREQFEKNEVLDLYKEFIHFGLTSFDVDCMARPLMLRGATKLIFQKELLEIQVKLKEMCVDLKDIPMLARTHGQPASPTVLGKEINVFFSRVEREYEKLDQLTFAGKLGGATGNLNAHYVAYPHIDWDSFADGFIERLGLKRTKPTTQIEPYDNLAEYCHILIRINNILIDLSRDMWQYISMDYFKQKVKKDEVGSSAMPHKVNPIDFENAEGNLGFANVMLDHFANKLTISRLQRDLSDSTVIRNMGVPLAHCLIAFKSLKRGLGKVYVNEAKVYADLEDNWAVVAEAIQTILRRENYPDPYTALKELTRTGEKITKKFIHEFVDGLKVSDVVKAELKAITPCNYTGKCD